MKISNYPNDQAILALIMILSGFGIVMMYSASTMVAMNLFNDYLHFFFQQIKWLALGYIMMFLLSNFNFHLLKKIAYILILLSWIFLIMGYFFKNPNNDAARWLHIGGRSWMTTSDFARISLIIFTALFIEKNKNELQNIKLLITKYTPFIIITILLILFQPDTSTAMMISAIVMIMLYVAGVNWKYLAGIISIGMVGLFIKIITTPHALNRITNWNDAQKIQSSNALGTGGILGSGLGDSIIKNGFLPEAHTDFILPIIGEELGFVGILILFILFSLFFIKGISIAKQAPDLFSIFLSLGIIISIVLYFLVNAAYVVGFAPTTGLPIPFLSYGGSHTIFTLISIGILLNIAKKGNIGKNKYYRGYSYEC